MDYVFLPQVDADIHDLIGREERRQRCGIELIASENFISPAVMEAMGSVLNNRYSEGYPGARYYGGQSVMDVIERLAIDRAKSLFKAGHANVQPHAGAPANIATYFALAQPGDTILGMDLSHGGHLTHGDPVTHISKIFNFIRYRMSDIDTGSIDYDEMRAIAKREKPKIILAGFSSYPRELDYGKIKAIAEEVGAYAVADVAHIAGLIVSGCLKNPFDFGFDVILSTTHKSLRGPRGGLILTREAELGKKIDKSVFPGFQGGPIMQMIAAKAVAFREAATPEFRSYGRQVIKNAQALARALMDGGANLITNGTDNHLMVIDCMSTWGKTGQQIQDLLDRADITLNKNKIPDDPRKAMDPSGVRLGTPALTTRGMVEKDMVRVAEFLFRAIECKEEEDFAETRRQVQTFANQFSLPGVNSFT